MPISASHLAAFGARMTERRESILDKWARKVRADPQLVTGRTMPRVQLNDHLTALLEDFEHCLTSADADEARASDEAGRADAAAHGLHRWQQGFDLAELARELGRFNECVVAEIDDCAAEPALQNRALVSRVHAIWAAAHSVAVSSSADQFFRLEQMEAASHVKDLEVALGSLQALEAERGELWQQAAHDLRGNLSVVSLATKGLARPSASDANRARYLATLSINVRSLNALLLDVTSLARLQGGQEAREVAGLDAALLMQDLREATEELARERGLTVKAQGPQPYPVVGDAIKVRRIVQNLLLNALRYTAQGGVTIAWGDDDGNAEQRWFIEIRDTGPGFEAGEGSPMASAINAASKQSKKMEAAQARGEVSHSPPNQPADMAVANKPKATNVQGEGIGLSIVKRLCALLDATIAVASTPGKGSTFRVVLPKRYPD